MLYECICIRFSSFGPVNTLLTYLLAPKLLHTAPQLWAECPSAAIPRRSWRSCCVRPVPTSAATRWTPRQACEAIATCRQNRQLDGTDQGDQAARRNGDYRRWWPTSGPSASRTEPTCRQVGHSGSVESSSPAQRTCQTYFNDCNENMIRNNSFYPLARVIGIATCLSVCPSVTRRYCVKTKKASGMISSLSGSPKFSDAKFHHQILGGSPERGPQRRVGCENSAIF